MIISEQKNFMKIVWTIIVFSIGYAILRYNIVGTVAWKELPIFILNKGVSLAAIILLTLSFSIRPMATLGIPLFNLGKESRKVLGIIGLLLTVFHALLTVLIFNPQYYPNFFEDDQKLSAIGNVSLMAGITSFMVLGLFHWCFRNRNKGKEVLIKIVTSKNFLLGILIMFGAHLFFMGYSNWLSPSIWQGGLPPISLLSFLVVLFGLVINGLGRDSKK